MRHLRRYVLHNLQATQDRNLRKIREPWGVLDTTTNRIVDEYASKRAAQMDVNERNREGVK